MRDDEWAVIIADISDIKRPVGTELIFSCDFYNYTMANNNYVNSLPKRKLNYN